MPDKYLFIGGLWLEDEEETVISKSRGNVQFAANALQMNIVKGLDANLEEPVTVLSSRFLGSFPKFYKEMIIPTSLFNHTVDDEHLDFDIGFINLPFYKHLSRFHHIRKYLKNYITANKGNKIFIIGYSMSSAIVNSLLYAKEIDRNVVTCLIVPDLPEYMNFSAKVNTLFRIAKLNDTKQLYNSINDIDCFVLLTRQMYESLNVTRPFIVMEGICPSVKNDRDVSVKTNEKKQIVYTGTLEIKYGICELIEAFIQIPDKDIELVICGAGNGEPYLREKMKEDRRIRYLGLLSNRKVLEIQRNAYILVNPRNSKEVFTKYSFPSKTMEYMYSGRPVLMYKLDGIPEEYDEFLYYVKNDSLVESLRYLLSLSEIELSAKGAAAREFVLDHKNKEIQTKKIIDLLNSIRV